MRQTQIIGLSDSGKEYVCSFVNRDLVIKIRNNKIIEEKEIISSEESNKHVINDDYCDIPLKKYLLKDGNWVFEKIQEVIWSSGPMYFLALENDQGEWLPETFWTKEELKLYNY